MPPAPPDVARLLAIPPQRFAAARAAAAKALAEAGDPSAGAVRKLRRPTGLAWVLNRIALDRPDDVDALVAAGDRVRAGQRRAIAGGGAEELRAAEAELRERARSLRLAAGEVLRVEGRPASAAALARVELLLRTTATAPGPARDALRSGHLEREPDVASADLSGLAVVAGRGEPAARRDAQVQVERSADGAGRGVRRRGGGTTAAAAERQEREERTRARHEAQARERARKAAGAALARARAVERRADAAARGAEAAARRAASAAASAGERARTLRARADEARAEAGRREAALAELSSEGP